MNISHNKLTVSHLLSWCWNKLQLTTFHFSQGINNIAFWILTTFAILIALLIVVIVIIHFSYKIGFYGRSQPFHTKNDMWHKLIIKQDCFIDEDEQSGSGPQWTRHCDVSQTTIVNGDNVSEPLAKDIYDFLVHISSLKHNSNSRISLITREPSYIVVHRKGLSSSSSLVDTSPIDCLMTATPATLLLVGQKPLKQKRKDAKTGNISLPIYTIEYATDDKKAVGSTSSSSHFQSGFQISFATLHFFQQSNTPQTKVSLFRTNGLIWNIVPLCVFKTMTYTIDSSLDYKFNSAKELRFFNAKKENIRGVVDFISKKQKSYVFDIVITKELTDMLGLINNKTLVIVGCVIRSSIIGTLFFTKRLSSSNMELCGSVFDDDISDNIKMACFSRSLILANRVLKATHIDIPSVSHNKFIIDMIENRNGVGIKPSSLYQNAYYLRNYRTHTRKPERCLII